MRSHLVVFVVVIILSGFSVSPVTATEVWIKESTKESANTVLSPLQSDSENDSLSLSLLKITVNTTSDWSDFILRGFQYHYVENTSINVLGDPDLRFEVLPEADGFLIALTSGNLSLVYCEAIVFVYVLGFSAQVEVNATIQKGNLGISGILIDNVNDSPFSILSFTQTENENQRNDLTQILSNILLEQGAEEFIHNTSPRAPESVLAFYYPWYANPEISGAWDHWESGNNDPDTIINNQRQIGATNYPLFGAYDSADTWAIKHHIRMAQASGIDGFISSWWGWSSNSNFEILLDMGDIYDFKSTVYVETAPLWDLNDTAAHSSLIYKLTSIYDNFAARDSFYTIDGVPAVFIYVAGAWNVSFWENIKTEMDASGRIFNYQGDVLDSSYLQVFDGIHSYMPLGLGDLHEPYAQLSFQTQFAEAITSNEKQSVATTIPGFDNSGIQPISEPFHPREGGATYAMTWNSAYLAAAELVLVTSFNEWHEGSELEYSEEYDDDYLTYTRDFRQLIDPDLSIGGDLDALTIIVDAENLLIDLTLRNLNGSYDDEIEEFRTDLDAIIDLYDGGYYSDVMIEIGPLIDRIRGVDAHPSRSSTSTETASLGIDLLSSFILVPVFIFLKKKYS